MSSSDSSPRSAPSAGPVEAESCRSKEQTRARRPQVDKTGRGHAVIQADAIERASGAGCHQDEEVSPPVVPDRHCGPVPEEAWLADAEARTRGRVEIFNAIKPDGMDHWTPDVRQYELMRQHILDMLDDDAGEDGTILLKVDLEARRRAMRIEPLRDPSPEQLAAAHPTMGGHFLGR